MEKIIVVLLVLSIVLIVSFILLKSEEPSNGLYRVGNLTICDKYHDKTICARG